MLAGGLAGGLFGIGWGILGVAVIGLIVLVVLGALLAMFLGGADITGGLGFVLIGIALVGALVGLALVIVSVILSRRILRNGGVNRPVAVTWLSLLIVLVINTIAQRIADPWISLGGEGEIPAWSRVVVSLILIVVAVGAGIGAWLLMAYAFRGAPAKAASVVQVELVPDPAAAPPPPPTA